MIADAGTGNDADVTDLYRGCQPLAASCRKCIDDKDQVGTDISYRTAQKLQGLDSRLSKHPRCQSGQRRATKLSVQASLMLAQMPCCGQTAYRLRTDGIRGHFRIAKTCHKNICFGIWEMTAKALRHSAHLTCKQIDQ